jgi:hypothetical protein
MKNLFLALLVLIAAPAFAQEMAYTDPTQIPIVDQTYTVIQQQTPTPIEEINNSGGTALTLYDDGVSQAISLGFDFYFYGNLYDSVYISQNGFISFTNNANGCCNGQPLPYFTEWTEQNASYYQYYSVNNSIFAMWSDLADFNTPGNPYYKVTGNSFVVGWYGVDELSSAPYTCDEMGCYSSGLGNKFTFEISLFSDSSFSINYGAFDYNNQTGRMFTAGYQGDQEGEVYQIYNGNDPSSLQNTTYFVQSSEITSPPPEESNSPIAPDCTINPYNTSCIINSTTDDEDEIMLAEEIYTESDDEDSIAEEEFIAMMEEAFDDLTEEEFDELLEELLAEELFDDDDDTREIVVAASPIKEMVDEEKASALSDSISKDVLEFALAVASTAESNSSGSTSESSSSSSSSRSSSITGGSETTVASTESGSSSVSFDNSGQEQSAAGDASMELLETGRAIGQEALASTVAGAETSASDSMSQAESIAQVSSFDSLSASLSVAETINSIEIENVIEAIAAAEPNTDTSIEMMGMAETTAEIGAVLDGSEIFVSMENNFAASSVQGDEEIALAVVNNSILSSEQKTFEDEYNADVELTNAMIDPAFAIANTFNQPPSMMNLEILGIVKPIEDKSDAEIRAEQVVAANKEEQDAINANYMEADQSGILAAIGSETDVTAYRSAMLNDNNIWYRPEDIYKNIVIRDNVRGMYFLEKGSTDTYKQMVEEQYKDE